MLFVKVSSDDVRLPLAAAEIASGAGDQFRLGSCPFPADSITFDVLVQQFVRVQFRAVARKVEQGDLTGMLSKPVLYLGPVMHRVAINNEKYVALNLAEQTSQELQEHIGVEAVFEHHEVEPSLISDS